MLVKDVPHLCKDVMLEFMLLKLTPFVPYKPVWKDMKLLELKMLLEKLIFSLLLLETEISSWLTTWKK